MCPHDFCGVIEVRAKISAEAESTVRRSSLCGDGEELGPHDAMFVMAKLWPGIRKKYEQFGIGYAGRKGFQKQPGFRLDEEKVFELCSITFSPCTINSVAG